MYFIKICEPKSTSLKSLQSVQQMGFSLCITTGPHLLSLASIYSSAPKYYYYNLYTYVPDFLIFELLSSLEQAKLALSHLYLPLESGDSQISVQQLA